MFKYTFIYGTLLQQNKKQIVQVEMEGCITSLSEKHILISVEVT